MSHENLSTKRWQIENVEEWEGIFLREELIILHGMSLDLLCY